MSWHRRSALLGGAAFLTACGFKPIAQKGGLATLAFREMTVETDNDRFRYHLLRSLAESAKTDDASTLRLLMRPQIEREGLAIEQNDTVTRFNLRVTTNYDIVQTTDPSAPSLQSGAVESITAVNATTSQFTTSTAERYAVRLLAEDTGRRILRRLQLAQLGG